MIFDISMQQQKTHKAEQMLVVAIGILCKPSNNE